ncbi:hypothetical protein N0V90_007818 [Kalmusia sp. IMI 367209]|nr:hypothetical protein N0V90_007818 [Kalmusia sp. IMI 367209]
MKTIAIIGTGPAGIIAARKLLQAKQFNITIFERGDKIGGSWILDGIINPNMRTNQSKFTMSFSDLSWESIDLQGQSAPIYPKASQVYQYLTQYWERYIPPEIVQFRTTVQEVEQLEDVGDGEQRRWKIQLCRDLGDRMTELSEITFDYIVAAPGFFSIPKMPRLNESSNSTVPILHSTQYRMLSDIDSGHKLSTGDRRVLVVGGSHSGGDIAALLALQISDAQYSPDSTESKRAKWRPVRVLHISSHEMFALPSFIRDPSASSCTFQPADFTLFDRSSRPADPPPEFTVGLVTPEKITASRKMIHTIVDGNEGSLDTRRVDNLAPIGILGDTYSQFLKTGEIFQHRGTVQNLESSNKSPFLTANITNYNGTTSTTVKEICAVIYATGFDVSSSLSFLSESTKSALEFDPTTPQVPIILDKSFLSQNSSIPTLAVLGFAGAYWPLLEMQARAIVREWTFSSHPTKTPAQSTQHAKLLEFYRDLRRAVKEGKKAEIPHNPFGDTVGAMEQASREFGLERFDLGFSETEGFICSARYTDPGSDKTEAMKTLMAIQSVRHQARDGAFLARAVFFGLHGEWTAACRESTAGVVFSHHSLHPRYPTEASFDWEYFMSGNTNGKSLRRVYRYEEAQDLITVWNIGVDGYSAESLYSTLDFKSSWQERGKDTAVAVTVAAVGSAEETHGFALYRFLFTGAELKMWTLNKVGRGLPIATYVRSGSSQMYFDDLVANKVDVIDLTHKHLQLLYNEVSHAL